MDIGRTPQQVDDFKTRRLLALDTNRIHAVDERDGIGVRHFPGDRQAVVEVSINLQQRCSVHDRLRQLAHKIADFIYEEFTGDSGYFDTQIVYVAESGTQSRRVKRLAIMDQDGHNHRYLTSGLDLVLTPRFSPQTHEIAYLNYFNDEPNVYIHDIRTGRSERLGSFPGMTFAPRFGPRGDKLIMSWAKNGLTDIYEMDLSTQAMNQLTKSASIDTSPSYAPDGNRIVFNSDRGGSQQLYVMDADGSNVRRISYGVGRYATPVWSPRGDIIAFTKMANGQFYIGVMTVSYTHLTLPTTPYV